MGCGQAPPPRASQHQRPHPQCQPARVSAHLLRAAPPRTFAACAHTSAPCPHAPTDPPPRIVLTRGRYCQIDDSATQVQVLPALCSAHLAIRSVLSLRTYTDGMGEASVLHERGSLVDVGGHGEASRTLRALYQISAAPCRRAVALPSVWRHDTQRSMARHASPPFAERDGLGNKASQGETPARHSRSTLATVARPPMPLVASSYRAVSPTSSTPRSHPPPPSSRTAAGLSAPKPHHALHASPGMADACRRGRACPWCAESLALTAPGEVCQDACPL